MATIYMINGRRPLRVPAPNRQPPPIGRRIMHETFGTGKVLAHRGGLRIQFDLHGAKVLDWQFAHNRIRLIRRRPVARKGKR